MPAPASTATNDMPSPTFGFSGDARRTILARDVGTGTRRGRDHSRAFRFNPLVECKATTHLNDYTDDEVAACWYAGTEYRQMRTDREGAVGAVRGLVPPPAKRSVEDRISCRGLEYLLEGTGGAIRERIVGSVVAVLHAQGRGGNDYDVRAAYAAFSAAAHAEAHMLAVIDRVAISLGDARGGKALSERRRRRRSRSGRKSRVGETCPYSPSLVGGR